MALVATSMSAEIKDGYYRIQNTETNRYIGSSDNYGKYFGDANVDVTALKTFDAADAWSNASTVIYIKNEDGGLNLYAQGSQTIDVFNLYLKLYDNGDGTYKAYCSKGLSSVYLKEGDNNTCTIASDINSENTNWKIIPISSSNYFGVVGSVQLYSDYYAPFYSGFPFTAGSNMTVYTIGSVNEASGTVALTEATGTIPAGTPVIIKTKSSQPADNKLTPKDSPIVKDATESAGVNGVFFCNPTNDEHRNVVEYDAATMRILSVKYGKLAFVTSDIKYIPANSIYLKVSEGAPEIFEVNEGSSEEEVEGDINGDGEVDGQDFVSLVNMILGKKAKTTNADINGDGKVTVADAQALLEILKTAE